MPGSSHADRVVWEGLELNASSSREGKLFHDALGSAVAVRELLEDGSVRLKVVSHRERHTKADLSDTLFHSDREGRRVFLEIVGQAVLLAAKLELRHLQLAGVSLSEEEARVDLYTFDLKLDRERLHRIIGLAKEVLSSGKMCFTVKSKQEVLEVLRESREFFLYRRALEAPVERLSLVEYGGNYSYTAEPLEGVVEFSEPIITLVNTSRVHWLGEATGIVLERLHVSGYPSKQDEQLYSRYLSEVRLRDHVALSKDMDIYFTEPSIGAGLILWTPNGARMRRAVEEYIYKVHVKRGYEPVVTPHIALGELFEISGHMQHYRENMFTFERDGRLYVVKPMNCPFHIAILKRRRWGYRELPVRYFELGTVYRYERGGTLHGLTRVRGMTQDDAHIFLREDQIEDEIARLLELVEEIYSAFGLTNYTFRLSVRDPRDKAGFMGSDELWKLAESSLEGALKKQGIRFTVGIGDAAFYGPKIDINLKDALGREWQCGTIQLDFNLPERFNLTYTDEHNREQRMVMIHRAIIGTIERFTGLLLEYYAGRVPLWLAPIQVVVLPVEDASKTQVDYARSVARRLEERGIRTACIVEGRLNYRIRLARKQRIPIIAVVGSREVEEGSVTITKIEYSASELGMYKAKEETLKLSVDGLIDLVIEQIRSATRGILP
uniref:Threonine--tRNA ligase n=1 Tax=Fervidicoccus fontis TaxID=683846 RepID=A0A7J3ZIG2_9CREN